jgi:hypothetical protein
VWLPDKWLEHGECGKYHDPYLSNRQIDSLTYTAANCKKSPAGLPRTEIQRSLVAKSRDIRTPLRNIYNVTLMATASVRIPSPSGQG